MLGRRIGVAGRAFRRKLVSKGEPLPASQGTIHVPNHSNSLLIAISGTAPARYT